MKLQRIIALTLVWVLAGCSGESGNASAERSSADNPAPSAAPKKMTRGGTITVGQQTWKLVPKIQCGVYPGDVVAIAGHAESDPDLEIIIDNDPNGRSGVRIGQDDGGGEVSWHSIRETLDMTVSGKQVRGSAMFSTSYGGAGDTAKGEFTVDC
jgi:hypothetical protein